MIGTSKAWFCGQDGSVYELTGQGGGSWFPSYGKNFTYTGEYQIVPEGDNGDWKVKFLTSGTFTATDALLIDVFAVGGGGGGGSGNCGGAGGGGGYTKTEKSMYLEKNKSYEIIIGDGGNLNTAGGNTSGFSLVANGGSPGQAARYVNYDSNRASGGNGGSGGGFVWVYSTAQKVAWSADAGSDGSDGKPFTYNGDKYNTSKGQGTTTREFGEATGDLYAGGGGVIGGYNNSGVTSTNAYTTTDGGEGNGARGGMSAESNTGGGGGGNGNGGSGIVIIRNHRE